MVRQYVGRGGLRGEVMSFKKKAKEGKGQSVSNEGQGGEEQYVSNGGHRCEEAVR